MPLLDKQRRTIDTRRPDYTVFRKRRRVGLLAFVLLLAIFLGGVSYLLSDGSEDTAEEPVEQANAPVVEEAEETSPVEEAASEEASPEETSSSAAAEEEVAEPAVPAPEDPTLFLTVPRLGVYGHTVRNDDSELALDAGAIKVPSTGFPWEEEDTNTYIAGHRVGWPGTESYYQLYELPLMREGDVVYLADTNGRAYQYRVFDIFAVSPYQSEITRPIAGKDIVSLQTCTESLTDWWTMGPGLYGGGPESGRLVVQAERI
jgi:sortase A